MKDRKCLPKSTPYLTVLSKCLEAFRRSRPCSPAGVYMTIDRFLPTWFYYGAGSDLAYHDDNTNLTWPVVTAT
jgi:hypothetical protein